MRLVWVFCRRCNEWVHFFFCNVKSMHEDISRAPAINHQRSLLSSPQRRFFVFCDLSSLIPAATDPTPTCHRDDLASHCGHDDHQRDKALVEEGWTVDGRREKKVYVFTVYWLDRFKYLSLFLFHFSWKERKMYTCPFHDLCLPNLSSTSREI